ncbi:MAG: hypothetical protein UT58_C0038G0004 [Microgenomates group bacterium GW2011_GWC1_39_7b]|uniref:Putative pre-16S rRNA nuclease n=2 Tax=Candidatus Woeseibacteriota TaxID=1752722 RepID=A0A0G0P1T9_9BACT|nr:MAG: hypothetical protein UT17_C0003G0097 [Candidatus Woesebacteria bacterium GW2011_GWB1_39_10]KKR25675.1 MAG: hypothetical protein UT58_C0038G0004 [Microgenomates group bacterium GW2011_GWC1_39_7b]KKS91034.1 MAG: hypothetical protein UV66_C0001G0391 [Candidatus Woesebacteria bacterium GW2011_GWA1_43_12]
MKILGIDYGRAKVGLAIAEGDFAEPWKVIRVKSFEDAIEKVSSAFAEASADKQVDKVVVGISEGEMGEESKKFAETLHSSLFALPFEFFDETLTSQDAQKLSREAGMSRKKARGMEDAFAASIMLQNYLESGKRT